MSARQVGTYIFIIAVLATFVVFFLGNPMLPFTILSQSIPVHWIPEIVALLDAAALVATSEFSGPLIILFILATVAVPMILEIIFDFSYGSFVDGFMLTLLVFGGSILFGSLIGLSAQYIAD